VKSLAQKKPGPPPSASREFRVPGSARLQAWLRPGQRLSPLALWKCKRSVSSEHKKRKGKRTHQHASAHVITHHHTSQHVTTRYHKAPHLTTPHQTSRHRPCWAFKSVWSSLCRFTSIFTVARSEPRSVAWSTRSTSVQYPSTSLACWLNSCSAIASPSFSLFSLVACWSTVCFFVGLLVDRLVWFGLVWQLVCWLIGVHRYWFGGWFVG
jgi:hypothetical protein